jgi:Rad3-related DNA helicase
MLFDQDKIDQFFPLPQYRFGQREAIHKIITTFNEGKKFVLLEAPTGSGKSAIGFTLAQLTQSAYYLSPQKFLQDQLTQDFGDVGKHVGPLEPMIDLKGRNNYPCNYWERQLSDPECSNKFIDDNVRKRYINLRDKKLACDQGECKKQGKSRFDYCVPFQGDDVISSQVHCPYYKRLYQAMNARICLMNFHSFIFQSSVTKNFGDRDLLIFDEAHNIEDMLLGFIEIKLSDRHFNDQKIIFPVYETVQEYKEYFQSISLNQLIEDKIKQAALKNSFREEEEWRNMKLRYEIFCESDPNNWVLDIKAPTGANMTIIIKPIFVHDFVDKYFFSKATHILMMSATLLSKQAICSSLGIASELASPLLRLGSTFPKDSRPLYFRPSGTMSYKNKADVYPKLVEDIDHLCRFHQNERGIIHTHNFEIFEKLRQCCAPDVSCRFLCQDNIEFDNNKNLLVEKHKQLTNGIILAPAMHEGLDLKDDLGRFQIICKVPYPSLGDPQIAARSSDWEYYNWRTATKLVQSYGRIYRHEGDYGVTYVLDGEFERFFNKAKHMLPKWFVEAIVWK